MIFLIGIEIQLVTSAPAYSQSKRVSSIATTTTAMADKKIAREDIILIKMEAIFGRGSRKSSLLEENE